MNTLAGKRGTMALMPMNLRLEAVDGSGFEEYRIYEGAIEVRKLRAYEDPGEDSWERVSHGQLAAHVKDDTVVAQWLKKRIGWQRLLLACTNPQTLEEFGIADNTLDRFAA